MSSKDIGVDVNLPLFFVLSEKVMTAISLAAADYLN
jgi:hypothetical protein